MMLVLAYSRLAKVSVESLIDDKMKLENKGRESR